MLKRLREMNKAQMDRSFSSLCIISSKCMAVDSDGAREEQETSGANELQRECELHFANSSNTTTAREKPPVIMTVDKIHVSIHMNTYVEMHSS